MFSFITVIFIVSRSSSYYFSWKIYIIRQYCENYCANILCTLVVLDPRIPSQLHKPRLSLKDTTKLLGNISLKSKLLSMVDFCSLKSIKGKLTNRYLWSEKGKSNVLQVI